MCECRPVGALQLICWKLLSKDMYELYVVIQSGYYYSMNASYMSVA